MHRIQQLASHLPLSPLTGPAASWSTAIGTGDSDERNQCSTEMIVEGQIVVTASLRGLAPTDQETRRLVDCLLDGPGFFIAKQVVPVRIVRTSMVLRAAQSCVLTAVVTCAADGHGAALSLIHI